MSNGWTKIEITTYGTVQAFTWYACSPATSVSLLDRILTVATDMGHLAGVWSGWELLQLLHLRACTVPVRYGTVAPSMVIKYQFSNSSSSPGYQEDK